MNQKTYTDFSDDGKVLATWGATYPVAYEYDLPAPQSSATRQAGAWGRMTAMATTRAPAYANQNLWNLLDYEMLLSDTDNPDYPPELDTTLWHYDLATGLLTGKTYSDGKGPSYTYTPDGKLASRTWARGVTTSYAYTNGSSLAAIDYSDDTPDVAFTYDRLGRQVSAITAGVSTNLFGYSPYGQLTNEIVSLLCAPAPLRETLIRTTDPLGRSTGFSLADSDYAVTYGYDAYGRFQSVTSRHLRIQALGQSLSS